MHNHNNILKDREIVGGKGGKEAKAKKCAGGVLSRQQWIRAMSSFKFRIEVSMHSNIKKIHTFKIQKLHRYYDSGLSVHSVIKQIVPGGLAC